MFKDILLPIDLEETEIALKAIKVAEELSGQFGASITALTAIPDFNMSMVASYFPDNAIKKAHDEVCKELRRFVDGHFKQPAKVHCTVGEGSPHKVIVKYVKANSVDLIVMPARMHDFSKIFLGSNSSNVVERAPCSVLVVRG